MELEAAKAVARAYWQACDAGGDVSGLLAERFLWDGPRPAPQATTVAELQADWLRPFAQALPDYQRSFHIVMAGWSSGRVDAGEDGRLWVAGTGYLTGRAAAPLWGIPVRDRVLRLRWGEFLCFEAGRIVEIQMLVDVVDWLEQIGVPVMPAYPGASHVWPGPTGFDGLAFDAAGSEATLRLGRGLLFDGLNVFDEDALESMGMARFFHPNLKWYGPGGIGACLSLQEFEDFHQRDWLESFPTRKVQDLPSLFAEGRLLAASGPAGVKGAHTGAPYRGSGPAQGQKVAFCGLDFWLRSGDVFTENWVFVDFVHLFDQLGIDLMERVGQR